MGENQISILKNVVCKRNPPTRTSDDLRKDRKDEYDFTGPPAFSIIIIKRYEVHEECLTHYWITNDKNMRMSYLRKFFDEETY